MIPRLDKFRWTIGSTISINVNKQKSAVNELKVAAMNENQKEKLIGNNGEREREMESKRIEKKNNMRRTQESKKWGMKKMMNKEENAM